MKMDAFAASNNSNSINKPLGTYAANQYALYVDTEAENKILGLNEVGYPITDQTVNSV